MINFMPSCVYFDYQRTYIVFLGTPTIVRVNLLLNVHRELNLLFFQSSYNLRNHDDASL